MALAIPDPAIGANHKLGIMSMFLHSSLINNELVINNYLT